MYFDAFLDLRAIVGDDLILSEDFGAGGQEVTLLLSKGKDDQGQTRRGRLVYVAGDTVDEIQIESPRPFYLARLLRNGNYLLYSHDIRRRYPVESDAFIYDRTGHLLHEFRVGSYIAHLQCDASDRTWVSYIDQGAGQPEAGNGLTCFTAKGESWQNFYHPSILDCYAMNVAKDAIWLCYYPNFPIVRLGFDGSEKSWGNSVGYADAIVARGRNVALFGGLKERRNTLTLLKLGANSVAEVIHETLLECTSGVYGRGMTLHTIDDDLVWRRLNPFESWFG